MFARLAHFLVLGLSVAVATAQTGYREVDLRVNGIGSGSPYKAVLSRFGRPVSRSSEKGRAELSCTGSGYTLVTLRYPGFEVVFFGDEAEKNLQVTEFTVNSNRWLVSGIRTGSTPSAVKRRFGKPVSTHTSGNRSTLAYVTRGNHGGVSFDFYKGRLTSLGMSETLC